MEWYKVAFGDIYPLVYPHRDEAEAARVAARLLPLIGAARPLLDVACGNGRYMRPLAAAGVDAYGADLSTYLLADAVANGGLGGRVVCCDMRALPFRDGAFGVAINMFTSFGYFDDDADNAAALREVARVLRVGGTFVLDFLNAGRVRGGVAGPTRRTAGDTVVDESRELSADGRVLTKRVVVRWSGREPVEYVERVRLYDRDDLGALLAGASLAERATYGDYDLGPFDDTASSRVIFVCEKRGVRGA